LRRQEKRLRKSLKATVWTERGILPNNRQVLIRAIDENGKAIDPLILPIRCSFRGRAQLGRHLTDGQPVFTYNVRLRLTMKRFALPIPHYQKQEAYRCRIA
jgi:hypothetical protein